MNDGIYVAMNMLCVIILLMIYFNIRQTHDKRMSQKKFCNVLFSCTVLLILDVVWKIFDRGSSELIVLSKILNAGYFCVSGVIGYTIAIWLETEQDVRNGADKKKRFIYSIPMWILIVLSVASFWTGWIFYIDEQGAYHRGFYYFLHIVCAFGPPLFVTGKLFVKMLREDSFSKRKKYKTLISFTVPVFLSQALQIVVQLPLLCAGFALGAVWVHINMQNQMISLDPLTGLNNRYQLRAYLSRLVKKQENGEKNVYIAFLDVDFFKEINDTFGHVEGDNALRAVADILRAATEDKRFFIARYGGDEFVMIVESENEKEIDDLCSEVERIAEQRSEELPYKLSFCVGIAKLEKGMTPQEFVALADRELYRIKQMRRQEK